MIDGAKECVEFALFLYPLSPLFHCMLAMLSRPRESLASWWVSRNFLVPHFFKEITNRWYFIHKDFFTHFMIAFRGCSETIHWCRSLTSIVICLSIDKRACLYPSLTRASFQPKPTQWQRRWAIPFHLLTTFNSRTKVSKTWSTSLSIDLTRKSMFKQSPLDHRSKRKQTDMKWASISA